MTLVYTDFFLWPTLNVRYPLMFYLIVKLSVMCAEITNDDIGTLSSYNDYTMYNSFSDHDGSLFM